MSNYTYLIKRPCLWFATGEIVTVEKMQSYYTPKAIRSLINEGYVEIKVGVRIIDRER
jgi:hypothetical protein